jgi:cytochrome c oxidase subunit III
MKPRPLLDVSELPGSVLDHRATIWWANVCLLIVETMMFALLFASYFYVRPNFGDWPPPQGNFTLAVFNPVPALRIPTIGLILHLLSLAPMICADRAALHHKVTATKIGMAITVLAGLALIVLRFYEYSALRFRWDDNAYASIVWTTVGLHQLHLLVGTLENVTLTIWLFVKGMDDKHARDVRVGAVYWYWIVAMWLFTYVAMYLSPRWL